ncbi:type II toxin-antitoxin system RnlB family antitoxin [Butyrivibrio hungatei]|uniref:Uncharacterized protein n=1 Tax=Butyrivibrio hungatei TaxID=185008 RepID=A0A1D9P145_9FIRM|nr:type II toxin-antitoxin system RnlB family antitoxin [Butyrivibrio hungatei]AOZ96233.1 hypothetical protein bhn_I1199 [Butyrivibrio hungatei]
MNELYELVKLNNEPYDFLVIAKTSINPLDQLENIERDFENENAKVIFDLTLINGLNTNRYISGECINGKFVLSSFIAVSIVGNQLKNICDRFFINNKDLVDGSVLSRHLKFLIKEKMV